MSDTPQAYPLTWPLGKPRTPWNQRVRGGFESNKKPITSAAAAEKVTAEVERLGGIYPILSSNVELRKDGLPRMDRGAPSDPGVCLYFQREGKPYAMACDTYDQVQQNIAAIANHIDATRRIERYGVATAAEMLNVFQALPNPDSPRERPWWEVLGVARTASDIDVQAAFRRLSIERHPDRGGSHEAMAELTEARAKATKALAA